MRKYIVGLLGALAASAILLFPAAFGDFQKGIVNAEDVTLRKSASAESASVKKLPRGAEVTVSAFENGWFKIEYGEFSGYVKQDQLTLKSIASEVVSSGKVLLDDVNLRSKPDVNSSIITVLKIDASVEVSEKIDNWYRITSGKNKGYVQCEYIELTEPAAPAAPAFNALKMGMSGKEVVSLQEQLRALGYYKAESHGNFGAFTRDAVKAFQQENGLLADGDVIDISKRAHDGEIRQLQQRFPFAVFVDSHEPAIQADIKLAVRSRVGNIVRIARLVQAPLLLAGDGIVAADNDAAFAVAPFAYVATAHDDHIIHASGLVIDRL